MSGTTKKDLPPKPTTTVKGGKFKLAGNDNFTLIRGAKPAKKDLPAGKDVKGGAKQTPRIALNDNLTLVRNAKPAKKDLPAGKHVKGGRLAANDNLTLVRAAKPAVKDLPAGKDIKGGKKTR